MKGFETLTLIGLFVVVLVIEAAVTALACLFCELKLLPTIVVTAVINAIVLTVILSEVLLDI